MRKRAIWVSDQVRHKPAYKVTEAGSKLERLDLSNEKLYYLCSENKGAEVTAQLMCVFCFRIMKQIVGFLVRLLKYLIVQFPALLSLFITFHRAALRATSGSRKDIDGVRTVKYNRLALEFKDLYTWVFIGVKEAEIMKVLFLTGKEV